MNFLKLPERVNRYLHRKNLSKLSRKDLDIADRWTLQLIRDGNPTWSEQRVREYHDSLVNMKVFVIDDWEKRFGIDA